MTKFGCSQIGHIPSGFPEPIRNEASVCRGHRWPDTRGGDGELRAAAVHGTRLAWMWGGGIVLVAPVTRPRTSTLPSYHASPGCEGSPAPGGNSGSNPARGTSFLPANGSEIIWSNRGPIALVRADEGALARLETGATRAVRQRRD
jgi:hypothetical protein